MEPPYGYFSAATLLHHVAGNPGPNRDSSTPREPLPNNIVDIARVLLDAAADVNASTIGPNGGTTLGLIVTSQQASNLGVAGPLMQLLLDRGAKPFNLKDPAVLDASLINHAPRGAEKLIELAAKPDVLAAAALGRMDLLRACFDDRGRLRSRPRRHGTRMSERDAIGLALLLAHVRGQPRAVDFLLEKDGNWNMIDVNNRDNPFFGTAIGWAHHNKWRDSSENTEGNERSICPRLGRSHGETRPEP